MEPGISALLLLVDTDEFGAWVYLEPDGTWVPEVGRALLLPDVRTAFMVARLLAQWSPTGYPRYFHYDPSSGIGRGPFEFVIRQRAEGEDLPALTPAATATATNEVEE